MAPSAGQAILVALSAFVSLAALCVSLTGLLCSEATSSGLRVRDEYVRSAQVYVLVALYFLSDALLRPAGWPRRASATPLNHLLTVSLHAGLLPPLRAAPHWEARRLRRHVRRHLRPRPRDRGLRADNPPAAHRPGRAAAARAAAAPAAGGLSRPPASAPSSLSSPSPTTCPRHRSSGSASRSHAPLLRPRRQYIAFAWCVLPAMSSDPTASLALASPHASAAALRAWHTARARVPPPRCHRRRRCPAPPASSPVSAKRYAVLVVLTCGLCGRRRAGPTFLSGGVVFGRTRRRLVGRSFVRTKMRAGPTYSRRGVGRMVCGACAYLSLMREAIDGRTAQMSTACNSTFARNCVSCGT